jgi:hypothetical protein
VEKSWHEVLVLPEQRHKIEYVNCAPATRLAGHFDGEHLG